MPTPSFSAGAIIGIISGRSSRPIARIAVRRPLPCSASRSGARPSSSRRTSVLGLEHSLLERLRGCRCRNDRNSAISRNLKQFSKTHGWGHVPVQLCEYSSICAVRSQGYEISHVGDGAGGVRHRLELRHHEAGVGRQVQVLDARDDLVTQLGVEVHAVGLEQLLRRRVIAFGLDALHLGQQPRHAGAERRRCRRRRNRSSRPARRTSMARVFAISQCTIAWRLRMWSSSSCVPIADPAQLHERVPRVGLVLGLHDRPAVRRPETRPISTRYGSATK